MEMSVLFIFLPLPLIFKPADAFYDLMKLIIDRENSIMADNAMVLWSLGLQWNVSGKSWRMLL